MQLILYFKFVLHIQMLTFFATLPKLIYLLFIELCGFISIIDVSEKQNFVMIEMQRMENFCRDSGVSKARSEISRRKPQRQNVSYKTTVVFEYYLTIFLLEFTKLLIIDKHFTLTLHSFTLSKLSTSQFEEFPLVN